MPGTLYLVPTPIGNLGDISRRCADTLAAVDFVAAEDTRVTLKLLNYLGLKKPLVSYYRHNTAAGGEAVLERLLAGESCALVTALAVSGLPTGRFTFEGFLAMNRKNRRAHLAELAGERRTMIFYEAPHKLRATLEDLAAAFGPERRISLCRELTKLHEEVRRTTLGEAAAWYEANPPRGEFVLVVEGAPETAAAAPAPEDALARVAELREQGLSLRDAVKQAAKETGLPKNELYDRAVGKHVEA